MIGKTVGKYRILDRLGRGGMGTVYRALDETLDRDVAIKVLNSDFDDPDVLKRFRAEAVTLARLNHPGIATIYELHRQDDDLLMVMEYVRGETLHALAERLGPLAIPQAAHLCMQVLDALGHAHRAGIVHRDLKPANLMISESGAVKVMDFGIARMLGTEHFTQGGYMMGTPAYMSPEQVLGKEIDGRSDLYSVGVVFYRLLAGELPFKADTSIAMVQKQVSEPPTPIATFRPDLPPWCVRLIDRALAKSPADRFQSADEFRAALAAGATPEALGELPTMATPSLAGSQSAGIEPDVPTRQPSARPAPPPSPAPAPVPAQSTTTFVLGRTHLVTLGAVLAVLVAGIAVFAFLALRSGSSTPPGTPPGAQAQGTSTGTATVPAPAALPPPPAGPPQQTAAQSVPAVPPAVSRPAPAAAPPPPSVEKPTAPSPADAPSSAVESQPRVGGFGAGRRGGGRAEARGLAAGRAADGRAEAASGSPTRVLPVEPSEPLVVYNVRLAQYNVARGMAFERAGILRLGNGLLTVVDRDGATPIVSVPYGSIGSAYISRSPQPWWRTPDGREMTGRVDTGRMALPKTEKNWLVVLARNQLPVVIQLLDGSVRDALVGFRLRTGVQVQRFIPTQ